MKRVLAALALAALLTACAARETDTRAETLQKRYAERTDFDARVEATVGNGAETMRCTLAAERAEDAVRVTVLAPEALAGVSAVVQDDDALTLEYEGMVLAAGSTGETVSAANCVSIFLRAAVEGLVVERGVERCADVPDALRLCFETEHAGEKLRVAAWFGADDAPLCAEIERGGEILAYLEFTDFDFGDILTA